MSITVGINGVTFPDGSSQNTATQYGMKNRIINGDMRIDQRNAGASLSISANSNGYPVDRFRCDAPVSQGISVQQSTVSPPTGFANSILYTVGTGSTGVNDNSEIVHFIEGYNIIDLAWGTANAKPITISFLAKSSLTGTFGLIIENGTGLAQYVTSYSIPVANTWTTIVLNIAGPTIGAWQSTNARGIGIRWDMGTGSSVNTAVTNSWNTVGSGSLGITGGVKLTQTTGATFNLAGVQLEKGSTATSFDYRAYGTELALCQRYFQLVGASTGFYYLPNNKMYMPVSFFMRASPSAALQGTCLLDWAAGTPGTIVSVGGIAVGTSNNGAEINLVLNASSGMSAGQVLLFRSDAPNSGIALSAEL